MNLLENHLLFNPIFLEDEEKSCLHFPLFQEQDKQIQITVSEIFKNIQDVFEPPFALNLSQLIFNKINDPILPFLKRVFFSILNGEIQTETNDNSQDIVIEECASSVYRVIISKGFIASGSYKQVWDSLSMTISLKERKITIQNTVLTKSKYDSQQTKIINGIEIERLFYLNFEDASEYSLPRAFTGRHCALYTEQKKFDLCLDQLSLPPSEIIHIFHSLATELKNLHSTWTKHGDIKSSNIFLTKELSCKGEPIFKPRLGDFDLASPFHLSSKFGKNNHYAFWDKLGRIAGVLTPASDIVGFWVSLASKILGRPFDIIYIKTPTVHEFNTFGPSILDCSLRSASSSHDRIVIRWAYKCFMQILECDQKFYAYAQEKRKESKNFKKFYKELLANYYRFFPTFDQSIEEIDRVRVAVNSLPSEENPKERAQICIFPEDIHRSPSAPPPYQTPTVSAHQRRLDEWKEAHHLFQ